MNDIEQSMNDIEQRLRDAFDSDSVPEKNIALRKAADTIARLRAALKVADGDFLVIYRHRAIAHCAVARANIRAALEGEG